MGTSFKNFVLNEAASVRTYTSVQQPRLKAWSIRSRSVNYFLYTPFDFEPTLDKIASYDNLMFYVIFVKNAFSKKSLHYRYLKQGYENHVDYSQIDDYYTSSYNTFITAIRGVKEKIKPVNLFTAANKLTGDKVVDILPFRGIHKLYNYLSLTKQITDYSIERIFGSSSEFVSKLHHDISTGKANDGGVFIDVMRKRIPVSHDVPKKRLKDVETAIKKTYQILNNAGLSHVYDSSRIIVTKIGRKALALYYDYDKTIRIDPTKFKTVDALVKTLIHEFGHNIDYEYLSKEKKKAISDVYRSAKNSKKEISRQAVSINQSDSEDKLFNDHVQKLIDSGRGEIVWMKRPTKYFKINKGVSFDIRQNHRTTALGKYIENDAPRSVSKKYFMVMISVKSKYPWVSFASHNKKRFGLKVAGRTTLLDDYRNKNFPKSLNSNGWQVYDNSWFVTNYAKTNPSEFWAEMFAWVILKRKTRKGVVNFVNRMLRGI